MTAQHVERSQEDIDKKLDSLLMLTQLPNTVNPVIKGEVLHGDLASA